jgi:hypothetical protein
MFCFFFKFALARGILVFIFSNFTAELQQLPSKLECKPFQASLMLASKK